MTGDAPPDFRLPPALVAEGFALRRESEADIPFLEALYASTRAEELALAPWTEAQKGAFLRQQFDAQRRHYYAHFAACAFDVLECGGVRVGRLYLERRGRRLHIVDISLLPEWRRRGVGTRILEALIDAGRREGRGVSIFVERFNPALALYQRLGFAEVGDHGVYLEMERAYKPSRVDVS